LGFNFWEGKQMFRITSEESAKIGKWLEEVIFPPIVEKQLKDPDIAHLLFTDENGKIHPYTGAIGGGLTYQFTPTSLGTVTKVIWNCGSPYEQVLDVTDYDCW
jgi:hypothetical protein